MKFGVRFSQSRAHKLRNFLGPLVEIFLAASLDGNLSPLNIYVRITALLYFSFVRSSHWKCSMKFHNIYRKTTVLESLFNKVAGLKRNCNTRAFLWVLRNFQELSICKRLLLIRTLLHFIHAIWNDNGIVTKFP